ncbi:P-loop containing nucleoside triphosphate hydrolase protein [Lentinula boryana]|uniref:P-loop containing nucleoside triphosphate hydrolase protein n=1 Tax=Lentinula boryana TaxID=40481 RepID=A0ABQ8Q742_9AGAR|nr:P-loop containing nucleoside triphosphate hydrolase protein [Lentinula boryana]
MLCGSSKHTSFGRRALQRKVVVCGDGACGKTSLLNVFTRGFFTQVYEPTVFENYVHDIYVDDQLVELSLWDTAGQEEFDRLRSLSYAETHVVMICFSVDNPISLENVETKWLDEILEFCPGVKVCESLVGPSSSRSHLLIFAASPGWYVRHLLFTRGSIDLRGLALKCDLRDDYLIKERLQRFGSHPVQYEEGLAVARRIRASRYLECSSKHNRGVSEVFYEAARVSLSSRNRGSSGCVIM